MTRTEGISPGRVIRMLFPPGRVIRMLSQLVASFLVGRLIMTRTEGISPWKSNDSYRRDFPLEE